MERVENYTNKPKLQHVPDIVSVSAVANIKLPVHCQ